MGSNAPRHVPFDGIFGEVSMTLVCVVDSRVATPSVEVRSAALSRIAPKSLGGAEDGGPAGADDGVVGLGWPVKNSTAATMVTTTASPAAPAISHRLRDGWASSVGATLGRVGSGRGV